MSQELDQMVEQKVKDRLAAIEKDKQNDEFFARVTLALLGAGVGYWLHGKTGAGADSFYWFLGGGAFLGFCYELLALAGLIVLVRCVA